MRQFTSVTFDAARRLLQRNLLFRGLSDAILDRLALLARRREVRKSATIFSQGDPGDALYGIVTGRVRISQSSTDGREVFLNIMEPGDTFGEIAVVDGLPRTAAAIAMEPSVLIVIERADFLEMLAEEPTLGIHLLNLVCQRLRWTSALIEESAFLEGPARLAKRLLVLVALHGTPVEDGGMQLAISQSELAHFLGISRQFVNQQLQAWRNESWVELSRSRIVVRDADALSRVVDESAPLTVTH